MTKKEREQRIQAVIYEVGYKKDLGIRPALLSMGEQKLLAFARALICSPKLLFLDEWTESLDDAAAQRLIEIIRKQQKVGATIIFVSHDLRIIKSLADDIVMIMSGKIFLKLTREQIASDDDLMRYLENGIAS
jgi:ABC-type multidrug transport system ATPase subunit